MRTEDGRSGWIDAACLRTEAAYLNDPANRDFVMCPSDVVRTFPVTPKGRQGIAALALRDVPSILGGDAQTTLTDAAGRDPLARARPRRRNPTPWSYFLPGSRKLLLLGHQAAAGDLGRAERHDRGPGREVPSPTCP